MRYNYAYRAGYFFYLGAQLERIDRVEIEHSEMMRDHVRYSAVQTELQGLFEMVANLTVSEFLSFIGITVYYRAFFYTTQEMVE